MISFVVSNNIVHNEHDHMRINTKLAFIESQYRANFKFLNIHAALAFDIQVYM